MSSWQPTQFPQPQQQRPNPYFQQQPPQQQRPNPYIQQPSPQFPFQQPQPLRGTLTLVPPEDSQQPQPGPQYPPQRPLTFREGLHEAGTIGRDVKNVAAGVGVGYAVVKTVAKTAQTEKCTIL